MGMVRSFSGIATAAVGIYMTLRNIQDAQVSLERSSLRLERAEKTLQDDYKKRAEILKGMSAEDIAGFSKDATEATRSQTDAQYSLDDAYKSVRDASQRMSESEQALTQMKQKGINTGQDYVDALKEHQDATDDLTRANHELTKAQQNKTDADDKANDAQLKLNNATVGGAVDQEKLAENTDKIALDQDAVAVATDYAAESQRHLNDAMTLAGVYIFPAAITGVTSLLDLYTKLGPAISSVARAAAAAGGQITGAATAAGEAVGGITAAGALVGGGILVAGTAGEATAEYGIQKIGQQRQQLEAQGKTTGFEYQLNTAEILAPGGALVAGIIQLLQDARSALGLGGGGQQNLNPDAWMNELPAFGEGGVAGTHGAELAILGERERELVLPESKVAQTIARTIGSMMFNINIKEMINARDPGWKRELGQEISRQAYRAITKGTAL